MDINEIAIPFISVLHNAKFILLHNYFTVKLG